MAMLMAMLMVMLMACGTSLLGDYT
jgi:hypothetical protein